MNRRSSKSRPVLVAVVALSAVALAATVSSAQVAPASSTSHSPGARGYSAFVIHPLDARVLYVASGMGIFKSSDQGRTWRRANDGLRDPYVVDLVISASARNTLYGSTPDGVFKSSDAGRHWTPTSLTTGPDALAVDPRDPNTVYAAGGDDVLKTANGGRSWHAVTVGRRVFALAIDPRQPSTVYAGAGSGVFKSMNAGRTWRAMNRGLFPAETKAEREHRLGEGFILAFAINPGRPQTLYLASNYGVFKSTNAARTWHWVSTGIPGNGKFKLVGSIAIDPRNAQTLYTGTSRGVFKSTNGGRRWKAVAALIRHSSYRSCVRGWA